MKRLDKNGNELYVGVDVDVPTPTVDDLWNFEFTGRIISFDGNYCVVEDGDGDCWSVEPERVELA